MPRSKTEYGYVEPVSEAKDLSKSLVLELTKIINLPPEITAVFLDEVRLQLHRYILHKEARTSHPKGRPTQGSMRVNAKHTKKVAGELIKCLYGEAGGLKHYIHNGIDNITNGNPKSLNTSSLIQMLQGVQFGCEDFLGEDKMEGYRLEPVIYEEHSPREHFALGIAEAMENILNKTPTSYYPQEKNEKRCAEGKDDTFTQILNACLNDVDNGPNIDIRYLARKVLGEINK